MASEPTFTKEVIVGTDSHHPPADLSELEPSGRRMRLQGQKRSRLPPSSCLRGLRKGCPQVLPMPSQIVHLTPTSAMTLAPLPVIHTGFLNGFSLTVFFSLGESQRPRRSSRP